jgi:acylphosphatase
MEAARFFVSGRVQGVGFRASTRYRALELGLAGYARNLADGRVEAFVQGAAKDIETFAKWLQIGPSLARVDDVQRVAAELEQRIDFGYS